MAVLLGLVGMVASLGTASSSAAPATTMEASSLSAAVRTAKTHVVARFRIGGLNSVQGLRSKRNRTWAAVNGYYRKPKRQPNLWVVYLRARDGRWRVTYSGIGRRAIEPKVPGVPCDVWPPFSEPSC